MESPFDLIRVAYCRTRKSVPRNVPSFSSMVPEKGALKEALKEQFCKLDASDLRLSAH